MGPDMGPVWGTEVVSRDQGMNRLLLLSWVARSWSPLHGWCHCSPSCGVQPPYGVCRASAAGHRVHPHHRHRIQWSLAAALHGAARHCTALHSTAAQQARSTCCPHVARWARSTRSFTPRFGAPAPVPLCPPCTNTPPLEPSGEVTHRESGVLSCNATEHRAAALTIAMPGTFHGDAQHPP